MRIHFGHVEAKFEVTDGLDISTTAKGHVYVSSHGGSPFTNRSTGPLLVAPSKAAIHSRLSISGIQRSSGS